MDDGTAGTRCSRLHLIPVRGTDAVNNTTFESYLADGCGRCDLFKTPDCKVHRWTDILTELRTMILDSGLEETIKWGSPCYVLNGNNVLMIASLKDSCVLSFFKGAALKDEGELLEKPGPNSRYARYAKLRSLAELATHREYLNTLIARAIQAEKDGVEVVVDRDAEELPDELIERFAKDPELRKAFDALTPGRQRSHALHVRGAKQHVTRVRRAEKCATKILEGKGFNER